MKKKRLKIDFFAILHPLFLMMLGLLFYFFAFCPPALFSYSSFTAARPSKTS